MGTRAKRIGRPTKPAQPGKRAQVTMLVRWQIKRAIDKEAADTGRTVSQVGEAMLERLLAYDQALKAMGTTMEKLDRDRIEGLLRRANWKLQANTGHWLPPEVHGYAPSGFQKIPKEDKS